MIPDFKTYLKESIWSDMQDRGSGELQKKEDDINNLSLEGLCSYLNENYTCRDDNCIFCQTMDDTLILTVALYWSLGATGYLFYTGEEIAIYKSSIDTLRCRGKLTYNYATSFDKHSTTISPKDKSIPVNNKFFIEVLDFFIDIVSKSGFKQQIKKKLSESIWSDMQDRGTGDLEKTEDKIPVEEMEDFIDKSLAIYARLYVEEGWEDNGEPLTYDIFAEVVKTSDSMQEIDDYENYTEKKLNYILKYAKDKWDVYSKKLIEYVNDEKLPF